MFKCFYILNNLIGIFVSTFKLKEKKKKHTKIIYLRSILRWFRVFYRFTKKFKDDYNDNVFSFFLFFEALISYSINSNELWKKIFNVEVMT